MLATSSYQLAEDLEELVSHHIVRLVKQTPLHVTFEAKSKADAQYCLLLLNEHEPQLVEAAGMYFIIASLSY